MVKQEKKLRQMSQVLAASGWNDFEPSIPEFCPLQHLSYKALEYTVYLLTPYSRANAATFPPFAILTRSSLSAPRTR